MRHNINLNKIIHGMNDEIALMESFKEKIQRYKIRDPFIKNFILRYENELNWDIIKNLSKTAENIEKLIQSQIANLLDSYIKNKTDENSKNKIISTIEDIDWDNELEILKRNAEQGNQDAITSLEIFNNNPEEAKNNILESINAEKITELNKWLEYFRFNDVYSKNPAFKYIILKPILNVTGKDRTPSTPINAAIVANIYEKIKNEPKSPINIKKTYRDFYIKYEESERETIKGKGGKWIKIPSKKEDPDNFEENIASLRAISYSSWCVCGDRFAREYLSKGAFWLFIIEPTKGIKQALIAIRLDGNRIKEIRGATTDQHVPEKYKEIIIDFLEKNKDISGGEEYLNSYYREMYDKEYKKYLNENIEKLLEFYKKHMPFDYQYEPNIDDEEGHLLLDWWRRRGHRITDMKNISSIDNWEGNELGLEFEEGAFENMNDKFLFNSILVGLLEHTGMLDFNTKDWGDFLGYDYAIVDTLDLNEIYEKTDDPLIGALISYEHYGYDADVDFRIVDIPPFIEVIKSDYTDAYDTISELLSETDMTEESFFYRYDADCESPFYMGYRNGIESGLLDYIQNTIREELPYAADGYELLFDTRYYITPATEVKISIKHNYLIEHIIEDFNEILNNPNLMWWENWNKMSDDIYDYSEEHAKMMFKEYFDPDAFIEKACEVFAEYMVKVLYNQKTKRINSPIGRYYIQPTFNEGGKTFKAFTVDPRGNTRWFPTRKALEHIIANRVEENNYSPDIFPPEFEGMWLFYSTNSDAYTIATEIDGTLEFDFNDKETDNQEKDKAPLGTPVQESNRFSPINLRKAISSTI